MIVSAIVATDNKGLIGHDNKIPWYLPADLKHFKKTTLGHHLIMGRKTYESIGKALPGRTTIVLTRDPYYALSDSFVVHTIEEALHIAYSNEDEEAIIAGGSEIYRLTMPLWDRLYLTRVDTEAEGDRYFPKWKDDSWQLLEEEHHSADSRNPLPYTFSTFERVGRPSK